jgi:hypothetical protein
MLDLHRIVFILTSEKQQLKSIQIQPSTGWFYDVFGKYISYQFQEFRSKKL